MAILTTLGYFVTIAIASLRYDFVELLTVTGFWSTPELLVLNWYFKAKENER